MLFYLSKTYHISTQIFLIRFEEFAKHVTSAGLSEL